MYLKLIQQDKTKNNYENYIFSMNKGNSYIINKGVYIVEGMDKKSIKLANVGS